MPRLLFPLVYMQLGGLQHPGSPAEPAVCHGQQEVRWLPGGTLAGKVATSACLCSRCRRQRDPGCFVGFSGRLAVWRLVVAGSPRTQGAAHQPEKINQSECPRPTQPRTHAFLLPAAARRGCASPSVSFYLYRPALPVTLRPRCGGLASAAELADAGDDGASMQLLQGQIARAGC